LKSCRKGLIAARDEGPPPVDILADLGRVKR
jgi:hypothetical protein